MSTPPPPGSQVQPPQGYVQSPQTYAAVPSPRKKRTLLYVVATVVVLLIVVVVAVAASHPSGSSSSTKQSISVAYTTQAVKNASPGNEILIVNMTSIHDTGYGSFFVNPATFELTTGGVSYSFDPSTFELTYAMQAAGVTLQDNGTTSGAVAFLIPSDSSGYSLTYVGVGSYNIIWVNGGSSSSVAVTVTTSTSTALSIGYNTPTSGNEYLVVNMTITDAGYSSFIVGASEFIVTTGGVAYSDDSATFSLSNVLQDTSLQSGEAASGGIAFQIPLGSAGFTFSYSTGVSGLYFNVNFVSA